MRAALILAALFLAPIIGGGFGELPIAIVLLLILPGVIAHLALTSKTSDGFPRAPGLRPLIVFLALCVVAAFFTRDTYLTVTQLVLVFGLVAAYALSAALCRDSRIAAAAVWTLVLAALVICVIGVRDYAIVTGGGPRFWASLLGKGTHLRLMWPFINPSFLAGFLVLAIPISMGAYLVTRPRLLAFLAGFAVVVQILALMLTGSKFGIISALFALLVLFILAAATKSLKHARFGRLIILSAMLLPLLIVFRGPVTSRIAEAESGGSQVHSTTFRIYTWSSTLGMIRSHPWVGVGPGAFKTVYPSYSLAGPTKHAHNSYLQIGAETGLPALAAFVVALAVVFWSGFAAALSRRTAPPVSQAQSDDEPAPQEFWKDLVPFSGWPMMNCAIFAALAGSAVTNLVDSDWYVIGIAFPFWVMAGVLAAQSGALVSSFRIGWTAQGVLAAICVVLIVLTLSLGLGDLLAPNQFETEASASRMIAGYRSALRVCPMNPSYHRELAKWLVADGNADDAARQIATAVRLSPYDFTNHYLQGMIAFHRDDVRSAARSLERAIKLNPNATKALMQLALVRRAQGDTRGFEAVLNRILQIEESDFERVQGVPEHVDTSYAYAHAYFGGKYLALGNYRRAASEFLDGIHRLENWVSQKQMREMRRAIGMLTPQEESEILELLRASYAGLAQAYEGMGKPDQAAEAAKKADEVPDSLE